MKCPTSATSSSSRLSACAAVSYGGAGGEHQVIGPEHQPARHGQVGGRVTAARDRGQLPQEAAIEALGGPAALALEPADEGVDVSGRQARVAKAASGEAAPETATTQPARGQYGYVHEAPRVEPRAHLARGPRREDVHGKEALDPFRMIQSQHEADVAAPVVPGEGHALEPEGVEQREHVALQLVLLVAALGHVGPPEPAQVRADHTRVRSEQRDHVPPLVPVLRPAVQKHDWRAFARGRYVRPQAAGVNELVLDACYVRDVGAHRGGKLPARATTSSRSARTPRAGAARARSCRCRAPGPA